MAKTRGRTRARMRNRGLLTELLGHPDRDWTRRVLGWIVRARAELTAIILLLTIHVALVKTTGWSATTVLITETSVIIILVCLPGTRARIWAVTSRHRIYTCMYRTRTMTPDGTLPYLYWASPSPVGERIRVWLPAGLSVSDLEQVTEAIAAACYAAEARVEQHRKYSHLVTITIVRRDPFTGKRVRPTFRTKVTTTGTGGGFTPLPARDTLPVPTPPDQHPTVLAAKAAKAARDRSTSSGGTRTGGTNPSTTTQPTDPPPVVGVGGTDVSDYV